MAHDSCPVCRIRLAPGQTHCPRCGLRVAPLERRRHGGQPGVAASRPPPPARDVLLRGLAAGAALAVLCAVAGGLSSLAGRSGTAVAGNALFAVVALCVIGAALGGGLRVARWGSAEGLRDRSLGRFGPGRTALLAAALVPLALLVALAALQR